MLSGEVKLRIRYLNMNDLEQIEALDKLCFPVAVRYNRYDLAYYLSLPNSISLAEVISDKIFGFIIVAVIKPDSANIVTIDVDPKYRNHGIGNDLIETAKQMLRELNIIKITLQVSIDNTVAKNFYLKHGFQIVKILKNYYPANDGYQMECNI